MVELILLGTHIYSCEFVDIDKNTQGFAISVEFVVHKFNEDQDDEFAYKFLRVRRSQYKVSDQVSLCSAHICPEIWQG
jgi:hypothetical protein